MSLLRIKIISIYIFLSHYIRKGLSHIYNLFSTGTPFCVVNGKNISMEFNFQTGNMSLDIPDGHYTVYMVTWGVYDGDVFKQPWKYKAVKMEGDVKNKIFTNKKPTL